MSSAIDSGGLDEPSEADNVKNERENSDCPHDLSAVPLEATEHPQVIRDQQEVLTVDQQSSQDDKQAFDQKGAGDVFSSRASHLEDKSNDHELEKDAPMQDHPKDQQHFEVVTADQNLHQNVGENDSRPTNCEEKSNDGQIEGGIPMEAEDNYSSEMYDSPNFIHLVHLSMLSPRGRGWASHGNSA